MAKTILSGASSYCTGAQAVVFVDKRIWGDLLRDDGTREADPASHATMTKILQAASGELEQAALLGGAYTPTDLTALVASTTNMAARVQEIVAWLALPKSFGRRQPKLETMAGVTEARRALDQLRAGVRIFGFQESADAGLPEVVDTRPAGSEYDLTRVSNVANRFFGNRGRSTSSYPCD